MENFKLNIPSPLQNFQHPLLKENKIELFIKRDDLIHSVISGNKWRKLALNLHHALSGQYQGIVSIGGPWSNHIHALAFAANQCNIKSMAIIKGEEYSTKGSAMLTDAEKWNMQLRYKPRSAFKNMSLLHQQIKEENPNYYFVPEGGANANGVEGCKSILNEVNINYDYIALACGTGTTLAGVAWANRNANILTFPAIKGGQDEIKDFVNQFINQNQQEKIKYISEYHFGGYAKTSPELLAFINEMEKWDLPLEQVYTAKMFYGLFDMIANKQLKKGTSILAIHTGGLQGTRSWK